MSGMTPRSVRSATTAPPIRPLRVIRAAAACRARALRLLGAVVLLAAFAQASAPPALPRTAEQTPALDEDAGWLALTDWVSQLRGLSLLRPVRRVLLTPDQLRERQAAVYGSFLNPSELETTRQLLVSLGFLGPEDDLTRVLAELYGALPMGFYDPLTSSLYVRNAEPDGPLERVIVAHEFTHALQDQHYGLLLLQPRPSENGDRDLAVSALIEGDALIVQEMYRNTTQPAEEQAQVAQQVAIQQAIRQVHQEIGERIDLASVPRPVYQEMYFPYLEGPRFIHAVLGTPALTTWGAYGPAVHALFANPPRSTAQVLHPEKYLRGEAPVEVPPPNVADVLGDDWRLLRRQVVGEFDHRVLLERHLPLEDATRAAAGWAGNRAVVWADDAGATVTVSDTRWDSADDAAEWAEVYAAWLDARFGAEAAIERASPDRHLWRTPEDAAGLFVTADRTLVVNAPTTALVDALIEAVRRER
jgi:hypothetical protein